ncbi:MAG: nucleotidyl transferase AbiEii/AbiGii toxin family protein [Bacillales bacterium]|nr:nucleotidyl transferase AbiEii/AbiGii toxin family protein [Bacillales bacterium]
MSWYKNNKSEWKEIIDTVSLELKRNPLMVEKDTIQSMFLYELSKSELPFLFKGGTSLFKAYDLIDRFSEDIDLSMSRSITDKEKKKSKETIIEIATELGLVLKNPDDVLSRHDYNKYLFEYESFYSQDRLEIMIETSYYQISYPVVKHDISCFIGKFCKNNNVSLPIEFEAISFEMSVQSLERTFIDKVFAVCDYKIQNMMNRDSRHLYDIAKIYPNIIISDDLKDLVKRVRLDRSKSKNNPSADPKYNINEMLTNIIESRFYEPDYKNITQKLLYEDICYDEAIAKGIKLVVDANLF